MILKNKNILITAGGTREYIDGVRVVTNISTGALGAKIAEEFYRNGCRVHYLHAKQAVMPKPEEGISESARMTTHQFVTTEDLMFNMKTIIKSFKIDVVIHSAAVSDFWFKNDENIKLSSSSKEDFIEYLSKVIDYTPKIIQKVKEWRPKTHLIGFKFTVGKTYEELISIALESGMKSGCTAVLANDKVMMKEKGAHVAYIVPTIGPAVVTCNNKNEIATNIVNFCSKLNDIKNDEK